MRCRSVLVLPAWLLALPACVAADYGPAPAGDAASLDATAPRGCAAIMARGRPSGVYTLERDAGGELKVFCENGLAGGGWRLVSVRQHDEGSLFGKEICLSTKTSCSGRLADDELPAGNSGHILLATTTGKTWLSVASSDILDDFLTRRRTLGENNFCHPSHFCALLHEPLPILAHSPDFQPPATEVASLWITSGGLALRARDGTVIAALNLVPYDGEDGALFIADDDDDNRQNNFGAVNGKPGALFYRY